MPINRQIIAKQSLSQNLKVSLSRKESVLETVKYYCLCCQSECFPIKAPIVENKILDKIQVSL